MKHFVQKLVALHLHAQSDSNGFALHPERPVRAFLELNGQGLSIKITFQSVV